MKKLLLIAFSLFVIFAHSNAQTPQAICYQALAKDEMGNSILEDNITIQLSIIEDSPIGNVVWIERHAVLTDAFGVFAVHIGEGQLVGGTLLSFANIDWGNHKYFLKVELDIEGGTNFDDMGTSQLISVPYALYAERSTFADEAGIAQFANEAGSAESAVYADTALVAVSVLGDDDGNPTNELQELITQGDQLFLQNADGSLNGGGIDFDDDDTNEIQELVLQNNTLLLQNPDGTLSNNGIELTSFEDNDSDPMNEIQELVLQNNTIFLQNADGTLSGSGVNISGSSSDDDGDPENELQELVVQNGELFLQNPDGTLSNNGIDIATSFANNDNDPENEIQELVVQNGELFLQNPDGSLSNNGIDIASSFVDDDNDPENEIQELVIQNGELFLQSADGSLSPSGISFDASDTNELQELSLDGNTISISNGNEIEFFTQDIPFMALGASFDLPQGISGEHIVLFEESFTVPPGKNFWITAGGPEVKILTNAGLFPHKTPPNMPVLGTGEIIEECMCTGILVDESDSITPQTITFLSGSSSYIVPPGKILFLKSGLATDEVGYIVVNGNPMEFTRSNFTRGTRVISFPEGTVIKPLASQVGDGLIFTGYLIDQGF